MIAMLCCGFVPQHKASRQQSKESTVTELYTEAIKHATIHRDTLSAKTTLEAIISRDSTYAPAYHLLARLTREPKKLVEYTERAYLADTTNRHYLIAYAEALINGEEYEKAVPIYQKIVTHISEPNHYRILAILLNSSHRTTEALEVLDLAEKHLGRDLWQEDLRKDFLLKTGQTQTAIARARKAVEEAPYVAAYYLMLAEIYGATRQDDLALETLHQAVRLDSTAVRPWLALCDFHKQRNNTGPYLKALEFVFSNENVPLSSKINEWQSLANDMKSYRTFYPQYDALIKRLYIHNTDNKKVAILYYSHLVASGKIDQALVLSKQVVEQPSAVVEDYLRVIELENHLERPDSVQRYINRAAEKFPKNIDIKHWQGVVASNNKEYEKAIAIYTEALELAESDYMRSSLWGIIGNLEYERNELELSNKAYDKALKYDAENSMVLNNYAYHLSLQGVDLERALDMATRATTISQNNSVYLDTKAWVLYKLGRYAEAKKVMQQAISLNRTRSYEYPLHYGDILFALGEDFMAKTYWRKALEACTTPEESKIVQDRINEQLNTKQSPQK